MKTKNTLFIVIILGILAFFFQGVEQNAGKTVVPFNTSSAKVDIPL